MTKEKKSEILSRLADEIEKTKEAVAKTKEAANMKLTGWSAAGDKYHAQSSFLLTDGYLKRLQQLKKEIEEASDQPGKEVKPVCCVKVRYRDGNKLEFILVSNAVSFPRVLFISGSSPLGRAIVGKKAGDIFSYKLDKGSDRLFAGRVEKVE